MGEVTKVTSRTCKQRSNNKAFFSLLFVCVCYLFHIVVIPLKVSSANESVWDCVSLQHVGAQSGGCESVLIGRGVANKSIRPSTASSLRLNALCALYCPFGAVSV